MPKSPKVSVTRQEVSDSLGVGLGRLVSSLPSSPCSGQTSAEIAAYYRNAAIGARAVVRQTHGGLLQYKITEIERQNLAIGRVYVRDHGAFYTKHGKNCFHPTGQTRLVVPTESVRAFAAKHPNGEFGYDTRLPADVGDQ